MIVAPPKVKDLVATYKYRVLIASDKSLNKEINNPDTLIPGLELAGFYDYTDFSRGVILGEKECVFISRLSKKEQEECFQILTKEETPFIIVGDNYPCPKILEELAIQKDFVVLLDDKKAHLISYEIYSYCISKLARHQFMHGTLLEIYGSGVLLRGPSGIGKSETALELVRKGHHLVADDSVLAYRREHHLYGRSPDHLKSLLEVRGLGIIDVKRLFGITSILDNCEIKYIIDLTTLEDINNHSRLSEDVQYEEIIGLKIPIVSLPVTHGRNLAPLIEVAVMSLKDRSAGHNSNQEFMKKIDQHIKGEL